MNRVKRHDLHEIADELRIAEAQVREETDDEPDEEARAELVKASSALIDAMRYLLSATEIGDEQPVFVQSGKRTRKTRGAPDDEPNLLNTEGVE